MKKILPPHLPFFFLFSLFLVNSTFAELRLPQVLSSDMVFQRNAEIKVWGWADKGESVSVSFNKQTRKTKASKDGKWAVSFPAMKEGGPYEMVVNGRKNTIVLSNILIGDVYVCSGQSNMAMPVRQCFNAEEEIKNANYPNIRLLTIPNKALINPADDVDPTEWKICTPENIPNFSGAAYFFSRKIHAEIGVPIGLISSNWGGTFVEPWTAEDCLEKFPEFRDQIAELKRLANQGIIVAPDTTHLEKDNPAQLFNGMIHPLINLKLAGVLWYQGEKNSRRAEQYIETFPNLIHCWRKYWEQPDLPFLYVQLANWRPASQTPQESDWAVIREAQMKTLELPNTGMAVAIDIGDEENIHPKNKQDVGLRLAMNALKIIYGKDVVSMGPIYKSMEIKGNTIIIDFDHKGSGLMTTDKYGYVNGFAIAGADKKFHWAKAEIRDNKIVVSTPAVPEPKDVRYAWANNPDDVNFYNMEGLPASPFRTGF
jgi:sialate O-acetylesterase